MGKLFKFLKPRVGAVLAIVAVLIIQAYCDLSLPGYTSDIVNVGIQQGGIDSAIPEQIAKDDMEKLLLFVSKDDQKIVMDAYTLDSKTYKKDAYVLKDDMLKDEDKEEKSRTDISRWGRITVPGVWQLQGWGRPPIYLAHSFPEGVDTDPERIPYIDPKINEIGIYRRKFSVPAGWKNREIYLVFE